MSSLAPFRGAPADTHGSIQQPKYLGQILHTIKNLLIGITEVILGCRHSKRSPIVSGRESCLDCGCWRTNLTADSLFDKTHLAKFKGRWRRSPMPADHPLDRNAFAASLRLPCCDNLRGATPKHKTSCRYASENCPGCIDSEEPHIRACRHAVNLVDTPGVGAVDGNGNVRAISDATGYDVRSEPEHRAAAAGLPSADDLDAVVAEQSAKEATRRATVAGWGKPNGDVPDVTLGRFLRDEQLIGVLFAANRQAQARIVTQGIVREFAECLECHSVGAGRDSIEHTPGCDTGCILDAIKELRNSYRAPSVRDQLPEGIALNGGAR